MPHMVIFRNAEGKSGNHMTESLEDAVRFVEHLRNNEQVTDARVFRMQEVQLEFKVLYKVEISEDGPGGSESPAASASIPAPAAASEASPPPAAPRPAPEAEPEPAAALSTAAAPAPAAADGVPPGSDDQTGGRFGLFSRS